MGLYSLGEEAYLRGLSGFHLFTRAHGMSENMNGPKNNILMSVLLVGLVTYSLAKPASMHMPIQAVYDALSREKVHMIGKTVTKQVHSWVIWQ